MLLKRNNIIVILVLIVSFLGFVDATYLTVKDYLGQVPPCSIVEGCEQVLTSSYSKFLGLPVSMFGVFYYLLVFLLAAFYLDLKIEKILKFLSILPIVGFLATLYFVYIQLFVLNYICLYCMFSALSSTLLLFLGFMIRRNLKF